MGIDLLTLKKAKQYADRDGVIVAGTDEYPTVQSAIDALPETGGAVYVRPGLYVESVRITKPNVHLSGTWSSIIKTPDNAEPLVNDCPIRVFADGCTIEGLQIDGNREGNPAIDDFVLGRQADGIGIYANRCIVRNNFIHNTIGHKIIVWNESFENLAENVGRHSIIIDGNLVCGEGSRGGIDIASTQNAHIPGNYNRDIVVTGNVVHGNQMVVHTAEYVAITDNMLWHGLGIHSGARHIICAGNTISSPKSVGVSILDSTFITISNNHVSNTLGNGIQISSSDHVVTNGNIIDSVLASGASGVVYSNSNHIQIVNNKIHNIGSRGIYLVNSEICNDVVIQGNQITETGAFSIEVGKTKKAQIRGNSVDHAIHIPDAESESIIIDGNSITPSTRGFAVQIHSINGVVRGNVITHASDGVRVGGPNIRVTQNTFTDVESAAVRLIDSPTGIIVDNNHFVSVGQRVAVAQPDTIIDNNYPSD